VGARVVRDLADAGVCASSRATRPFAGAAADATDATDATSDKLLVPVAAEVAEHADHGEITPDDADCQQNACTKECFMLRSLKPITSIHTLRTAYFGLFESKMSYGIIFWGNAQQLKKIFTLQKRVIRIMRRLKKTTSCRGYFKKLNLLTFPSLYVYKILIFIKTNSGQFPVHTHPYGTRKKGNFNINLERMTQIKDQVKQTGQKLYNMLPENFKELTIVNFKTKLRNILIENEFYSIDDFELYIRDNFSYKQTCN
jgi:hypothetical protein